MNPPHLFDSLVKNAIDFFDRALAEFPDRPKYSVMHFYQAVELFVKARLMREHWSLIITKIDEADYDKFLAGDFHSVTLDVAEQRLTKIVKDAPSRAASQIFKLLREHRNKHAHFFHPNYGPTASKETLQAVIAEQCKGWYYLHQLLTTQWQEVFVTHMNDIAELGLRMHRHRDYLAAKFNELYSTIEKEKSEGAVFMQCSSCGFAAAREAHLFGPLHSQTCLVCDLEERALKIICPECAGLVYVYDPENTACPHCEESISLSDILDAAPRSGRLKEELIEESLSYCCECEHTEDATVADYGDQWLCLNCLTEFRPDQVGYCGWCGERVTGRKGTPADPGCCMCAMSMLTAIG